MKTLIRIQFAAILAVSLGMGEPGHGQTYGGAGRQERKPAPEMTAMSQVASTKTDPRTLPPAAAAFAYYFEIQEALAQDSLTDVAANALALAEVVRKAPGAGFPAQLSNQARALASNAITLDGARLDFATVSGLLISSLKGKNPPAELGLIQLVYDPIFTRLYWLQRGDLVQNPYLGKYGVPWRPLSPPFFPQHPLTIGSS